MKIKKIILYILSVATILLAVYLVIINTPSYSFKFGIYVPYFSYILSGFGWTVLISLLIFFLSLILGFVMFWIGNGKYTYLRYINNHVSMGMFGSPMLVVVIVFYFFVGTALNMDSKLILGIASLTIYFSPFMMKLYISAYDAIDKNQFIVCDVFGFSKFHMYRYIILPQMARTMMPPLSANLATIIKSSSLLYLIGFNELYYNITTIQSKTFAYTEGYIIMMGLYLIITIPLLKLTDYLEKRIKV